MSASAPAASSGKKRPVRRNPMNSPEDLGKELHGFAAELFPICRSLTGAGVRQTLSLIADRLPASARMNVVEIPSGTKCFDWEIPMEWNIRGASLTGPDGKTIVDFRNHNLHVVGYSEPVDAEFSLEELQPHLFSLPEAPDAIPYVTSYYRKFWGFCLPHRRRRTLKSGRYHARIDSTLERGSMTYAEILIPGRSTKEILLSTYVCHPSMANNELSGPVVATYLARWIAGLADRRFSYRIVFVPETLGAIAYISRNIEALKRSVIAGFQITCVGDERAHSYMPSRLGGTLADKVALHALKHHAKHFIAYSFLDRGSDERQYCSPGVDLPVVSLMRSKYGAYPEYHTSRDDLSFVTPRGLLGSYQLYVKCLTLLENNRRYRAVFPCEPQMGKRGLYPTTSIRGSTGFDVNLMMNFLAYCDGGHDLIDAAERLGVSAEALIPVADRLAAAGLIHAEKDTKEAP